MFKTFVLAAAAAGLMFAAAPSSATAAPLSSAPRLDGSSGTVTNVHWRGWRHCHRRFGERYCHGGRRWNRGWDGPGIYLNFGKRHHGHHRDRSHRLHRKHRH